MKVEYLKDKCVECNFKKRTYKSGLVKSRHSLNCKLGMQEYNETIHRKVREN